MSLNFYFRRAILLIVLFIMSALCAFSYGIERKVSSPLCFTAEVANTKVSLQKVGQPYDVSLRYSTDGMIWKEYIPGKTGDITLSRVGDKVYFVATTVNRLFSKDYTNFYFFLITPNSNRIAVSGNVMSLLSSSNSQTSVPKFAFCRLFNSQNITTAPELPATELAESCYYCMFQYCPSLTKAPTLPATQLKKDCYFSMFEGCTLLNTVRVNFSDWGKENSTTHWLNRVAGKGEFLCPDELPQTRGESYIPTGWGVNPDYLCFTAEEANAKVALKKQGSPSSVSLKYSTDYETWENYVPGTTKDIVLAKKGDKVWFRATLTNNSFYDDSDNYYYFTFSKKITASGNVMSLLDATCQQDSVPESAFRGLFQNCDKLMTAPELPATRLASNCYSSMFSGCTSLAEAPSLPAPQLAEECYRLMFYNCSSLTQAPTLPANQLAVGCYSNMFRNCTSLTTAPNLPATQLANNCYSFMFFGCSSLMIAPTLPAYQLKNSCYSSMFSGCTSLTKAPTLPANQITTNCYSRMFSRCSALTEAPALPAEQLANSCYSGMFSGCTSLTKAPILPASQLTESCYSSMFDGCSALTKVPVLPAMQMKENCYSGMFSFCTSLTEAPELPATKLAEDCYNSMFSGCTSLSSAPYLPAKQLALSCYSMMFTGCSSLNKVSVNFSDWDEDNCYMWLVGVAKQGIFICPDDLPQTRGISNIPEGWTVVHPDYLCFTAEEANANVALKKQGNPNPVSLKYSKDRITWVDYVPGTTGDITLTKKGDKVWFRATTSNSTFNKNASNYYYFSISNSVAASGNIMSLLDACCQQDTVRNYAFHNLFKNCIKLTTAPILPALHLGISCYEDMFLGCTSLNSAPETLPAMILAERCYEQMFFNCKSLEKAPKLPATHLAKYCYEGMFWGCKNLTYVPDSLPAMEMAQDCYYNMFAFCEKLKIAPKLPATHLAFGCYSHMFNGCKSLNSAPDILPATQLAQSCYDNMFCNCTSLPKAPKLPAIHLATNCYHDMFYNCTSLNTTQDTLPAKELAQSCYHGMFYKCTSLKKAPKLPATHLATDCYNSMFEECTSLTTTKDTLPAKELAEHCYINMFSNCKNLQEAPVLPATQLVRGCYYGMFSGCNSLNVVSVNFSDWKSDLSATNNWLNGVAEEGVFFCPDELPQTRGINNIPEGWAVNSLDYLCFTAKNANAKVALLKKRSPYNNPINGEWPHDISLKYSTDRITWLKYVPGETGDITLTNVGDKVWFRADSINKNFSKRSFACYQFSLKDTIEASGNVMSLLDSTCQQDSVPYACFEHLFDSCETLTKAPKLPAKKLRFSCYYKMFAGCKSLKVAPELPAETLDTVCYEYMFKDCTSLDSIKVHFHNWHPSGTSGWLINVAKKGTFIAPLDLSVEQTGSSRIPSGWTKIDLTSESNAANARPNFQDEPEEEEVSTIAEQPIDATEEEVSYSLSGQRTTNKQGLIVKNGKILLVK